MRRIRCVDDGLRGNAAHVKTGSAQPTVLDQHRVETELAGADRRDIAAGAAADDENLAAKLVHSNLCLKIALYEEFPLDEERGRRFEERAHPLDEGRGVMAVDDPVIEGRRQVHHLARNETAVAPDRPHDDLVDADDRDLRPVDDGRRGDAAERAERGQRDRRAGKLLSRRDALPRRLADAAHFARGLVQSQNLSVAHHGDHQSDRRLGCNAEMHRAEALDDLVIVVVMRIDLRMVGDRPDGRQHEKGQHRQLRPHLRRMYVERGAQLLERGDVDLLDIGEMRDPARRLRPCSGRCAGAGRRP